MIGRISWAAIISLFFGLSAYADGLESRLEVYEVINGDVSTSQVEETKPGQILEYRLSYTNQSDGEFRQLEINGLVPNNTQYIDQSAKSEIEHTFYASIDGGRVYGVEPIFREVKDDEGKVIKKEKVPPSEYTHIRWKSKESIKEGQTHVYTYRVLVE